MASSDKKTEEWRKTRLLLSDAAGTTVRNVDITDVPNANAQCPVMITVQQYCDLGHWHNVTAPIALPPYDYR